MASQTFWSSIDPCVHKTEGYCLHNVLLSSTRYGGRRDLLVKPVYMQIVRTISPHARVGCYQLVRTHTHVPCRSQLTLHMYTGPEFLCEKGDRPFERRQLSRRL